MARETNRQHLHIFVWSSERFYHLTWRFHQCPISDLILHGHSINPWLVESICVIFERHLISFLLTAQVTQDKIHPHERWYTTYTVSIVATCWPGKAKEQTTIFVIFRPLTLLIIVPILITLNQRFINITNGFNSEFFYHDLTHWGRVTNIWVSRLHHHWFR